MATYIKIELEADTPLNLRVERIKEETPDENNTIQNTFYTPTFYFQNMEVKTEPSADEEEEVFNTNTNTTDVEMLGLVRDQEPQTIEIKVEPTEEENTINNLDNTSYMKLEQDYYGRREKPANEHLMESDHYCQLTSATQDASQTCYPAFDESKASPINEN